MINILIWNENVHETTQDEIAKIYPEGIHGCLRDFLSCNDDFNIRTSTLSDSSQGITDELLSDTDVLIWWGHCAHDRITEETAGIVASHVLDGMGFIPLHSSHHSKPFKKLMGTSCNLKWRHGDRERLWAVNPSHPILEGVPEHFEIAKEEMYGEPFDIPSPDETVLLGWFSGGEVFRSGVVFNRGAGKIFYFQPGHEEYPIFFNPCIQKIIENAVRYVAPRSRGHKGIQCVNAKALEK